MEVLVVGNTAYVDDEFCSKAFPGDHVKVVAAAESRRDESSPHASWNELLQHLEQAYEFDRVVYLSNFLTPHTDIMGDIELLRSVFRACMGRRVQLLYVAGPAGAEGAADTAGRTGKGIIARAANDLCRHYAAHEGVQAKILRVPFLYTASAALGDPFFAPLFDACLTGSVALQGSEDAAFPLLCAEELAVLVHRIFDSWDASFETLDVADTFHHTSGEVGEALKAVFPDLAVAYGDSSGYALPVSDIVRVRYGCFQRYDLRATSRPFRLAGMPAAQGRSTPCAPPSTASRCTRCLLNAWRRALPGSCSRFWIICSPNRRSSTCSIIACSTSCSSARCMDWTLA